MQPATRLSVDLGTTHTVAVVRRADQQARSLLFDGSPLLPSGVYVDPVGTVHTGRDAQRLSTGEPQRFEPYPKRRIDEGTVLLGATGVPVVELLAAVLRRVAGEASQAGVVPADGAVLTCPADWGQPRRELLREAARLAGLGRVTLVDEPVAAATYCVDVLGQQIPLGAALAIFDFGGGTLDVAVVRREPAGFRVLGTGGLDDLGGVDIDAALVGHLGQLVATRDPALWQRISQPSNPSELRDRLAFWTEVRTAKEMLSRASSAPVHVPGRDDPMHLTRDELERVAGPLVARAVDETRRVVERVGVQPAALLLVGGTSRLPLVASRLHARIGVPPSVPEQPELPVAYGGLLVQAGSGPTVAAAHPVSPSWTGPPPYATGGTPQVSSPPWGPEPLSPPLGLTPPSPAGRGASPLAPPSGPLMPPASPLLPPAAPPAAPVSPLSPREVDRRRRRRTRRRVVAGVAAAVAVTLAIAGGNAGVRWLTAQWNRAAQSPGGIGDLLGGGGRQGTLAQTQDVALAGAGAAAAFADEDTAYYAVVSTGGTELVALPAGGGKERWKTTLEIEPTSLAITMVGKLLLVDGDGSVLDDGDDVRVAVDAATGAVRWKKKWEERRDVAFIGTDVIVEARQPDPLIQRVDLTTGNVKWTRPGPDDLLIIDEWRASAVRVWPDAGKPAAAALPPTAGTMFDTVSAAADIVEVNEDDGRGYLLDAATGKPKSSGALPLDDALWVAFDGLAIGKLSDNATSREAVVAYRVDRFSKAWQVDLIAGTSVQRVKPCGPHLVCVAIDGGDADRVIAVDTTNGKQSWEQRVEWSDEPGWYASGDRLLFGDATFDTVNEPVVLGIDGTVQRELGKGQAMAVQSGRSVIREVKLAGTSTVWTVSVVDLATGQRTPDGELGSTDGEVPMVFAIGGGTVVAISGDRHLKVFRVDGLG